MKETKADKIINLIFSSILCSLITILIINHWYRDLTWLPILIVAVPCYIMLTIAYSKMK